MIGDLIKIKVDELPSRRARKKPFFRRPWFKVFALGSVILVLGGYVGVQLYLEPYRKKVAGFDLSQMNQLEESSIVYDRSGLELGRLSPENRIIVTYAQIPPHFIEALIATGRPVTRTAGVQSDASASRRRADIRICRRRPGPGSARRRSRAWA